MTHQQKIKEYDKLLQKYIDKKSFVKIFRTVCEEEEQLSGFILALSKSFLLLQLDFDFTLDGFAILEKDYFDSIRHSSYERTQRKIFKAEGLLDYGFGLDKMLELKNWTDIFNSLKKMDYHIVLEVVNDKEVDLWIGEIKKVTQDSIYIHNYNPNGVLDEKPSPIKFKDISIVKFGDSYSTTFRKYLRMRKKTTANAVFAIERRKE